jgi:hypothetical protein
MNKERREGKGRERETYIKPNRKKIKPKKRKKKKTDRLTCSVVLFPFLPLRTTIYTEVEPVNM